MKGRKIGVCVVTEYKYEMGENTIKKSYKKNEERTNTKELRGNVEVELKEGRKEKEQEREKYEGVSMVRRGNEAQN